MSTHFLCGHLYDGLNGTARTDQTVVVEDGRIRFVGPTQKAPVRENGDEVIDHSSAFVMPGLVDVHTHLAYGNAKTEEDIDLYAPLEFRALRGLFMAQRVLKSGYTSIANPGDAGRVTIAIRDAINAGLFDGPRITTAGPYLTSRQGLTDWYPTWIGVPETAIGRLVRNIPEAIDELRRQVKDGVDFIKVAMDGDMALQPTGVSRFSGLMAAFNQDEINAIVTEAHRLGKKVAVHARGAEAVLYSARAGADLIFHASWMDDAGLDAVLENDCTLCPTLTLVYNDLEFSQPTDKTYEGWARAHKEEFAIACDALNKARKAGAKFMTGTDSGFAVTPYGEWHAREIEIFVEHLGFSPQDAIRCATSVSASFLRDGDQLGAIEVGRFADMLVLDQNPFDDVTILQDPERRQCVYQSGKKVTVETRSYDPLEVSDFSYNMWSDIYTRERVLQLRGRNW